MGSPGRDLNYLLACASGLRATTDGPYRATRARAYTFVVELGAFTGFFPGFHFQSDSPDDAGHS